MSPGAACEDPEPRWTNRPDLLVYVRVGCVRATATLTNPSSQRVTALLVSPFPPTCHPRRMGYSAAA